MAGVFISGRHQTEIGPFKPFKTPSPASPFSWERSRWSRRTGPHARRHILKPCAWIASSSLLLGTFGLRPTRRPSSSDHPWALGRVTTPRRVYACDLLQTTDVNGRSVLDIGTGSGVLVLAAIQCGASSALGIDNDPDAIASAQDNLLLNPTRAVIDFQVADVEGFDAGPFDVVIANLTGPHLLAHIGTTNRLVRAEGVLIASGILEEGRKHPSNGIRARSHRSVEDRRGRLGGLTTRPTQRVAPSSPLWGPRPRVTSCSRA